MPTCERLSVPKHPWGWWVWGDSIDTGWCSLLGDNLHICGSTGLWLLKHCLTCPAPVPLPVQRNEKWIGTSSKREVKNTRMNFTEHLRHHERQGIKAVQMQSISPKSVGFELVQWSGPAAHTAGSAPWLGNITMDLSMLLQGFKAGDECNCSAGLKNKQNKAWLGYETHFHWKTWILQA